MTFSVVSHNFVSIGWNLINFILHIISHGVVMTVKFDRSVIR